MDYERFYRDILELQADLQTELLLDAEDELAVKESLRRPPDYKKVRALASTFDLQEYVAGLVAIGRAADAVI